MKAFLLFLKQNQHFEHKPWKADMDNLQASIFFYLHFKGFYAVGIFQSFW